LFLDLRSEKDLILENYKLSIDVLADIIIVQDKIVLLILTYNIILKYHPIRPIDTPTIQLLLPEVILELEQKTINNILAFDLIILIYESISSNKRAKKHFIILIARGTTKPPAKKKH
jgi:hypothetical protein